MALHSLQMVQNIPAGIDEVWELFSNPQNLVRITPEFLDLKIISPGDHAVIFPGQKIEYNVRPLWNIPFHWITEIREVQAGVSFVDVQRKGPYAIWEHHHHFRAIEGGVEMTDRVDYQNPLGIFGRMANTLIVRRKLKQIFAYRYHAVEKIFGAWKEQQPVIQFS